MVYVVMALYHRRAAKPLVVAYIVTAYIVMAYVVMALHHGRAAKPLVVASIVMAMAYIGMAYDLWPIAHDMIYNRRVAKPLSSDAPLNRHHYC